MSEKKITEEEQRQQWIADGKPLSFELGELPRGLGKYVGKVRYVR